MRKALPIALLAAAAGLAGCASVWPTSVFFLKRDPSEIATGARAPPFTLKDASGEPVALDDLLARGKAVLVFYRGHW